MLEIREIRVGYGKLEVLHGVSLQVGAGEVVSLIGANAAGKSTTLNAVVGVSAVRGGSILLDDEDITALPCHQRVERGLVLVPQGRQLFGHMTVAENLDLGAFASRATKHKTRTRDEVFDLFPALASRRHQEARTLSGGEQSMVAIGRGLMAKPRLLMLDEPTEGLSPLLVSQTMDLTTSISQTGVTTLLVEQNVVQALKRASRGYVIESGRIVLEGRSAELLDDESLRSAWLGM